MPLVSIDALSIRFGGVVALDGVSLDIEPGQIGGLIGPNGAGKTTVFNCITRVYEPERGLIRFNQDGAAKSLTLKSTGKTATGGTAALPDGERAIETWVNGHGGRIVIDVS